MEPSKRGNDTDAQTRQAAHEFVMRNAPNPSEMTEFFCPEFNDDKEFGGYAFVGDGLVYAVCFDGAQEVAPFISTDAERVDYLRGLRRKREHATRTLTLEDVSPLHRLAIKALVGGCDSVADLAEDVLDGASEQEVSRAGYLLLAIRGGTSEGSEREALRLLAATDWLFESDGQRGSHPCPICGRLAVNGNYGVMACERCFANALCRHGRRIDGFNVCLSGGFEARHVDDNSICEQVTADNRCWVDGYECDMNEAKFGGIDLYVQMPLRKNMPIEMADRSGRECPPS